jgi:serpin B
LCSITEGKARDEITWWVAQKTMDKIQSILPPGSLTDLTRLVLANAVYFQGAWSSPFDKVGTANQPFHLSGNRDRNVPLRRAGNLRTASSSSRA